MEAAEEEEILMEQIMEMIAYYKTFLPFYPFTNRKLYISVYVIFLLGTGETKCPNRQKRNSR